MKYLKIQAVINVLPPQILGFRLQSYEERLKYSLLQREKNNKKSPLKGLIGYYMMVCGDGKIQNRLA